MTRAEHLKWCKERAIESFDFDKSVPNAVASMCSDFGKHAETRGSVQVVFLTAQTLPQNPTRQQVVNWINGFN